MNELKELNEVLKEPSADEALKSVAEILENENFNGNDDFSVNEKYVYSADFHKKCDRLTTNSVLNEAMYIYSKEALKHRNGTPYEDMYLFDARTGKVIAKQTDGIEIQQVAVKPETLKACSAHNSGNIVSFHTHPASMPPSAADFNSVCSLGWGRNYIICHNGRIFGYSSYEMINEDLYDALVRLYVKLGRCNFNAQVMAIEQLMKKHDIKLWEVN